MGQEPSGQFDARELARRYAEGRGTLRELRSAVYFDLDGPLTGGWADMFNAFERWEDTLHVDASRQAAIEAEIRVIAASLAADPRLPPASTRR